MSMKKKGFTLIEVALVVGVLGILAALYTASTGDLSDISVDAASRKIQSDLRYAHHLARMTGTNHGAVFTQNGGYEVYRGSPGNYVIDPSNRGDLVVDLGNFEGVVISNNYQVEFDSIGKPIMGGSTNADNGYVQLNAASGATRRVYVIDQTGAVVVDFISTGSGCSCELCMEPEL